MGVGGGECVFAFFSASRCVVVVVLGILLILVTDLVTADGQVHDDDSEDKRRTEEEDRELCEQECRYGCCQHFRCCDPHPSAPSYTVQVVAVAGAFLITILLLFICLVRYRMAARITNARHDSQDRPRGNAYDPEGGRNTTTTPNACTSVCSRVHLNIRSFTDGRSQWTSLRTLLHTDGSRTSTLLHHHSPSRPAGGEQIDTPPSYSELYPQGLGSGTDNFSPPPYEEVVMESQGGVLTVHTSAEYAAPSSSSSPALMSQSTSALIQESRD